MVKYKVRKNLKRFTVIKGDLPMLVNPDLAYDEKISTALDSLDMILDDEIVYQGLKSADARMNWKDLITGALIGGLILLIVGYVIGTMGLF